MSQHFLGWFGCFCLLVLTAINAQSAIAIHAHGQMLLLVLGIIGVTWGLSGEQRRTAARQKSSNGMSLWLLVGVLLLAALVRLWHIGDGVHFFTDELHFADAVSTLRDDGSVGVLVPFHYIASFTWVYPYLQLGAVGIFGAELTALRVISAAFGVLTVAATYALAVEFQHRTGRDLRGMPLLAALVLALFPPHVHFSRIGLNNIADPFFGVLALALLLRANRMGRTRHYALAGMALGLSQYFYEGGRIVFPALIGLWWGWRGIRVLWHERRRNRPSSADRPVSRSNAHLRWRQMSAHPALRFVLVFALIAAPAYITLLTNDYSLTNRLSRRGPDSIGYWLRAEPGVAGFIEAHLLPPITHFITTPDGSRFFYGGDAALVLPWLVPFFLFGLWLALRRGGMPLLIWLALTIAGNSLIDYSDWTPRFVVAFPAAALLIALGMARTMQWGEGKGERIKEKGESYPSPPRSFAGMRWAVVVLLIAAQPVYYFAVHLPRTNFQVRPARDHQDVAFRARHFPADAQVHIISDALVWEPSFASMLRFWGIERTPFVVVPAENFTSAYIAELPREVDHAFFVEPDDASAIALITGSFHYRAPEFSPFSRVPVQKQYALFYAPHRLDGTEFPPR